MRIVCVVAEDAQHRQRPGLVTQLGPRSGVSNQPLKARKDLGLRQGLCLKLSEYRVCRLQAWDNLQVVLYFLVSLFRNNGRTHTHRHCSMLLVSTRLEIIIWGPAKQVQS